MVRADLLGQLRVLPGSRRWAARCVRPGVVALARHTQHPGQQGDLVVVLLRMNQPELHLGRSVSRAKKAAALRKISFSSRRILFSRRSRASSSFSALVRPSSRRPSSRSAWRTQIRIDCAEGWNSLASSSGVRPARTSSHHLPAKLRRIVVRHSELLLPGTRVPQRSGVHQTGPTPFSLEESNPDVRKAQKQLQKGHHTMRSKLATLFLATLAAGSCVLAAASPALASSNAELGKRKWISSESGWQRAGVFVEPGDLVRVQQVGGSWTVDHRKFDYVSGRGYTWRDDREIDQGCKILNSRTYGTLIGKLNGTSSRSAPGSSSGRRRKASSSCASTTPTVASATTMAPFA